MKIFWWQLGLHFEPETSDENKALRLLFNNVHVTSVGADPSAKDTGVLFQQLSERSVCDLQVDPSASGYGVEKLAHQ